VADHKRATIIGSGVNGLTTAIVLQEAGWDVAIWTAAPPQHTTSIVAAAIWYPYKAYPEQAVLRWGTTAFTIFAELAAEPGSGVIMRDGVEIWLHPVANPWWRSAVPGFGRCVAADLPPGYQDGYAFRVPVIDMPIYLGYLLKRFVSAGGTIETRQLRSLDEALANGTVVINCAGLAARELIGDTSLVPIRGQVVWVTNPGIERFMLDESDSEKSTYIVPRLNDCVLGGTADEGAWDTTPDPAVAEDILRRCTALEPQLSQAHIIGHRVGLRPARPAIRLERETRPDGSTYIHNYGHGGAGVTLSWGCAYEVAQLAENVRH
jgi:D-amino-acid oxidase